MKRLIRFACTGFVLLCSIQLCASRLDAEGRIGDRRDQTRNGVCFYTDENYRGESYCAEAGESRRNVGDRFNDRFSSIRVFDRSQVTVYDDENFGGSNTTFTSDVPNLRNWNDRITSFQVTGGRQIGGPGGRPSDRQGGGWDRGRDPRNGACFYADSDYRGERFCIETGERLRNVRDRFNDRISSIRVFGRARVTIFENENFSGASRSYNRDIPNLRGFNDKITSIEVR